MSAGERGTWTPGPWGIEVADHDLMRVGPVTTEADPYAGDIVARPVCEIRRKDPANLANARLIAAAPELYEALEGLSALCAPGARLTAGDDERWADAVRKARAALLKARGGEG